MPRRLLFSAILLLAACGGGDKEFYEVGLEADRDVAATTSVSPESTGDGWNVSTPLAEGIDTASIQSVFDSMRNGSIERVDSLLVARHGKLVAEGYFNGYSRDAVHDLRSAGKSFVSTLAGIAIDQGLFALDDPVATLLPGFENHAHMDDRKRRITVNHLLNMRSGLECNDWEESSPGFEERIYHSDDWIGFVLDLHMAFDPGMVGQYCTGGVVLLGEVIARRSGMGLDAFAQANLFGPLQVPRAVWRPGPDGRATAATGMRLRPRDLAKLGQLYLDDGAWNGMPVLPSAWVARSQQRVLMLGRDWYGYLWWKRSFPVPNGEVECFFAFGNGGNFTFVIPALDLVVTFTASNYNSTDRDLPFGILANRILPAVH
jgi:CubicO group peptidase (beta-lactamase class C family)